MCCKHPHIKTADFFHDIGHAHVACGAIYGTSRLQQALMGLQKMPIDQDCSVCKSPYHPYGACFHNISLGSVLMQDVPLRSGLSANQVIHCLLRHGYSNSHQILSAASSPSNLAT